MTDPHSNKRRLALKTLTGSAIAGGLVDKLPALWQRPLVQSSVLPAHAQGFSPIGRGGGGVPRNLIQLTLTDPSGSQGTRTLQFTYQVTRTGGAITSFNINSGSAFTAANAPAPGVLNAVFPAAYAQSAPPTTPIPLILTQDLVLSFPNDQTLVASGMLELSYGGATCDNINITVTLLPGRTHIQQITAATTGSGMCGTLQLAPATGESSGLGTLNTSIAFESAAYTATEGAAEIQIKLIKTGEAEVVFRITRSGTATDLDIATATLPASGVDRNMHPFNVPITFPAAMSELTLNFAAARDELIEADETLGLRLAAVSANPGAAVVGAIGQTVVTIRDVPPITAAPTTPAPPMIPAGERWYEWTWGSAANPISGDFNFTGNTYYAIGEFRTTSAAATLTHDDTFFHQYQVYKDGSLLYTVDLEDGTYGSVTEPGGTLNEANSSLYGFSYDTSGTAFDTSTASADFTISVSAYGGFVGLVIRPTELSLNGLVGGSAEVLKSTNLTRPIVRQKMSPEDGGVSAMQIAPPVTIEFVVPGTIPSIPEGGTLTIRVTRTAGPFDVLFTIAQTGAETGVTKSLGTNAFTFDPVPDGATVVDAGFGFLNLENIRIPSDATYIDIPVLAHTDSDAENAENVIVVLFADDVRTVMPGTNTAAGPGVLLGDDDDFTFTITDPV